MLDIVGVVESFLKDAYEDDDKRQKLRGYQVTNIQAIQREYNKPAGAEDQPGAKANKAFGDILKELNKEGVRPSSAQERILRAELERNGLK